MDSAVLSVVSIGITGLLTFAGTMYRDYRKDKREDRQRKWDREDREEKAHEVARRVEKVTDLQTGKLLAAVEDSNQKTTYALDTANGFNGKIAMLHERMDSFESILRQIEAKLP